MTDSYREIEVKPVAGYIGADISGIDLSAPLSDRAVAEVGTTAPRRTSRRKTSTSMTSSACSTASR